eukprot:TRINITY_DN8836_c0_g2_i1.p1 TRINITY_DN8836_c0_g2~~TRINITY_DN8836_c0_g2_i1.p1  ORF type:complete len:204 (+),score=36.00 TRINITY_DN8836_c0_g2_i1:73-684(+)
MCIRDSPYSVQPKAWPSEGKYILGHYDENNIVVYQAFSPSIGKYAAKNQTFAGCPTFSMSRMTWIKTNFLWMMYRSNWGTKKGQEVILAIWLKREGFDAILSEATTKPSEDRPGAKVRLQWDPDHTPSGGKCTRRAIQLGLRGDVVKKYVEEWIVKIEDISEYVNKMSMYAHSDHDKLLTPEEKIYTPADTSILTKLGASNAP